MAEANRKIDPRRGDPRRDFVLKECPLTAGEQNADLLLDYVSRKLAPEMTEIFERHVAICPACRAFSESQSAVWSALDAFEAMPVSEDFDRKLWARIEAKIEDDERRPWWSRVFGSFESAWKPAIPVAAMALVVVGLWMKPGGEISSLPLTKAELNLDAEQIDSALEDLEMLRELGLTETGSTRHM